MGIDPTERHPSTSKSTVIGWLLDSDPSLRWQVMRDLTDASEADIQAERAKVATEGLGTQLLALQGKDGRWGGCSVESRVELDHACLVAAAGHGSRSRK